MEQIEGPGYAEFREAWLADVTAGKPSTTELARRFTTKMLEQWLDLDLRSGGVELTYFDGAHDGGIDAAALVRGESEGDGDTWYLAQSKFGSALGGAGSLMGEASKLLSTLTREGRVVREDVARLRERLSRFRERASERDRIVYVFVTDQPLPAELLDELERVRAFGKSTLGPLFDAESASIESIYLRMGSEGRSVRLRLRVRGPNEQNDMVLTSIPLLNLYDFMCEYERSAGDLALLYQHNVRQYLNGRTPVNQAITQTIQERPEEFARLNNGIVLVVRDFVLKGDRLVDLVDPYVVNGAQTTRTIYDVLHARVGSGGTGVSAEHLEWLRRVEGASVTAKIVRVGRGQGAEEAMRRLTESSNYQNKIVPKDFLALDHTLAALQREVEERYSVYLEVQRGGIDARRALERRRSAHTVEGYGSMFDLVRVYAAGWLGESGVALGNSRSALSPGGALFERIVHPQEGTPIGADDLFAAYTLTEGALAYRFGRGATLPGRAQARYVFYRVACELLRATLPYAGLAGTNAELTAAILGLRGSGALRALLDSAVEVIDLYFSDQEEHSAFREPCFYSDYRGDLGALLKANTFGRDPEKMRNYFQQLAWGKQSLGRPVRGLPSVRQMVVEALQEAA